MILIALGVLVLVFVVVRLFFFLKDGDLPLIGFVVLTQAALPFIALGVVLIVIGVLTESW